MVGDMPAERPAMIGSVLKQPEPVKTASWYDVTVSADGAHRAGAF